MRMRVRTSTTAYISVSGKAGALALQRDFSIVDPVLLHTLRSMLHAACFQPLLLAPCPSGPGDEAELVVLL